MRESWHQALANALSVPALAEEAAGLEIAFGQLRAVVVYVLELGRAHRLAATGNVAGDDVWLALGNGRIRFTLNRREGLVRIRRLRDEQHLTWSRGARVLVDQSGSAHDLVTLAQGAVDELVSDWKAQPSQRFLPSPAREFEDEPTKG